MYRSVGLYIHYPYCDVKCAYCDFYSIAKRKIDLGFEERYQDTLIKDFEHKVNLLSPNEKIVSIFLGGGTPSKASVNFYKNLLNSLYSKYQSKFYKKLEITVEANPESLIEEKVIGLLEAGVNRFSVGIQSRDPKILRYLGRVYREKSYEKVLPMLKSLGVKNLSMDLIYGVPKQRWDTIKNDIDWGLDLGITHISTYALTIEPKTLLEKQVGLNKIDTIKRKLIPSEYRQVFHQNQIEDYLSQRCFMGYEISNYALAKNFISRHNLDYWKFRSYIGIGVAAHSFFLGKRKRLLNIRNLSEYMLDPYSYQIEMVNPLVDLWISLFRIRTFQSFSYLRNYFSESQFFLFNSFLEKYANKGWLKVNRNGFQMLYDGCLFSDTISLDILSIFE